MKKHLIVLWLGLAPLLALTQTTLTQNINSLNATSGTLNYYSGQIIAPSSTSTPDNLSGTSVATFTGGQEVDLLPGFTAGTHTGSGIFHALTGTINPVIVSTAPYYKYQKFEIGLQFTSGFQAITYINNYMSSESTLSSPIVNCG